MTALRRNNVINFDALRHYNGLKILQVEKTSKDCWKKKNSEVITSRYFL